MKTNVKEECIWLTSTNYYGYSKICEILTDFGVEYEDWQESDNFGKFWHIRYKLSDFQQLDSDKANECEDLLEDACLCYEVSSENIIC